MGLGRGSYSGKLLLHMFRSFTTLYYVDYIMDSVLVSFCTVVEIAKSHSSHSFGDFCNLVLCRAPLDTSLLPEWVTLLKQSYLLTYLPPLKVLPYYSQVVKNGASFSGTSPVDC